MATYSNISDKLQSTVFGIINADSTSLTFKDANGSDITATLQDDMTVLDGIPEKLLRGEGFPYVIIRTPTRAEVVKGNNPSKSIVILNQEIEIWTKKEGDGRIWFDAIANSLRSNQATTRVEKFYIHEGIDLSDVSPTTFDDESVAWNLTLNIKYRFVG